MIALLLAAIFGWSQPCFAFPAQADPVGGGYVQSVAFAAPAGAPRLWSTQAMSVTVAYSDTTQIDTISLQQPLALQEQDGSYATRAAAPYTVYLCAADKRPGVLYLPLP